MFMDGQQILGSERIRTLLIKYSVPAIIGMLVNSLYNIVDRIFIGNIKDVGPLAITGLGVTMPIMTVILAFGMLVGLGTTTNISIRLGEGRRDLAEKLLGNAVTLAVIVGILIMVVGQLFADKILLLFGASERTLVYAEAYIRIILIGAIPNMLSFSLNHTIRGDGNPKISARIMAIGCITNIILDALFIFKLNMGIRGAATATIISQTLTMFMTLSYYLGEKSNLKIKKENLKLNSQLVKMIFGIGMSPFAMQIAASFVQVISNNALKNYGGDLAIGAMTTIMSIAMLFLMPIFGINQGSQPIIGFNYGAGKFDRVKKTYFASVSVATIILIVGWMLVMISPEPMIAIFNKDSELMNITVHGIRLQMLMMPVVGISVTGSNFIQSVGKAKVSMALSLLRQVIILIPAIIILPKLFGLGLTGVWLAQPLADFVAAIITIVIIIREIKSY